MGAVSVLRYNPAVKKILVRVPQWLGDAVVSTVFLTRLHAQRPNDEISVLCVPHLAPIFESHPAVRHVIKLPYPVSSVWAVGRMLREKRFDESFILPRSFRAALESFLGRIPRRIGYGGDLRNVLLTDVFGYVAERLYAHRYLALIGEESFPLESVKPTFPSEPPNPTPALKSPVLGIAPVSMAPARTWAPERFAAVANDWQQRTGGTVVLFGSSSEKRVVQTVGEKIDGAVVNTAGGLTLPQLGWMVNQCDAMVVNDSGIMHVASAFEIPTVVVFGASDPTFAVPPWGPFSPLQRKVFSCVPCLRNTCVRMADERNGCLKAISPAHVAEALQLISGRRRKE